MAVKVSIITPVYNAIGYIEKAYDSICRQTLKDVEWLVIDDGSDDGTYNELNNLAANDSRIRVFQQNHMGAGAARNLGLTYAAGEYIAFLDIDDEYLDKEALYRIYGVGSEKKADIVGSLRVTETFNGVEESVFFGSIIKDENWEWINFKDYQEDYHFHSYVFKRDFIDRNNIRFPNYKRYQDPVFLLKALDIARKVLVVPVVLYKYSYGSQNIDAIERNIADLLKGIRDNLRVAAKENYAKLFAKLINRVNLDYYPYIMRNLSDESFVVLGEISMICTEYSNGSSIKILPLENIKTLVTQSTETFYYEDLSCRYEKLVRPVNKLEKFFFEHDFDKIAIYGLGAFGRRIVSDLEGSRIKIVAGIDKNTAIEIGIPVVSPEDAKDLDCKAVVVTPIWYGDMASRMEKIGRFKIVVLKQLIYQLGEEK